MADNIKDLTLETATDEVKTDEIETVSKETVEVEETAKTGLLGATANSTGDVPATSFTTKTAPDGTDNLILFNQNTNVGYQIDYDNLADAILNKITSKTFSNQVGGSSAATLLAQLSTLNSNITLETITLNWNPELDIQSQVTTAYKLGRIVIIPFVFRVMSSIANDAQLLTDIPQASISQYGVLMRTTVEYVPIYVSQTNATLKVAKTLAAGWHYGNFVYICN